MSHLVLSALVNSIFATAAVSCFVCLILQFISRDTWNATTREAVWWAVLAIAAISPLLYVRSEIAAGIHAVLVSRRAQPLADVNRAAAGVSSPGTVSSGEPEAAASGQTATAWGQAHHAFFPFYITSDRWPGWILSLWIAASLLMFGRLIVSLVQLSRRKRRSVEAPEELSTPAQQWLNSLGARRRAIRVALSTEIQSPAAAGPVKPTILIPVALCEQLESAELEQITLHEVAHLSRRDDYWLLIQRTIEAVFVFHPVIRWITRQIDLEREIACDDFVINMVGAPRRYAMSLTRLVEIAGGVRGNLLGASAAEHRSHLERRVDMLLNDRHKSATRILRTRLSVVLAALAFLTLLAARLPGILVLVKPAFASTQQASGISVTVPVIVTDRLGRYVAGLDTSHFQIREDGVLRQISEFLPSDWKPASAISIVLVFNGSGAIGQGAIPQEALRLLTRVSNPADEFALIRSDGRPRLAVGFTRNIDEIQGGFTSSPISGGRLLDGVRMAIDETRKAHNARKAIVIVYEGSTDVDAYTEAETRAVAASAGMPIYSMSVFPTATSAALFDNLALSTGGRHFSIRYLSDLGQSADIVNKITVAVRNFYLLTFQSTNDARDGRYHTITVQLLPPRGISSLRWENRAGYYSPVRLQRN